MTDAVAAVSKIETRALGVCGEAALCVIDSHEDAVRAAAFLNERINALIKEGDELFDPMIAAAHQTHKLAIAAKKKAVGDLPAAATLLRKRLAMWQEHVEEEARQERIRLETAAREEEARRIESEVEAIEASGSWPEDAAAQVAAVLEAPRALMMPAPAPPQKIAGITTRDVFRAEVVNIREFCRAIGDGRIAATLVEPNHAALNKMAAAMQDCFNLPGCRVVTSKQVSSRS